MRPGPASWQLCNGLTAHLCKIPGVTDMQNKKFEGHLSQRRNEAQRREPDSFGNL